MKKAILVALAVIVTTAINAQTITQTLTINPGWNAIYLEVQPADSSWDFIFNDSNIQSVWAWDANGSGIQFIQDPDELEPFAEQWRAWKRGKPLLTDL